MDNFSEETYPTIITCIVSEVISTTERTMTPCVGSGLVLWLMLAVPSHMGVIPPAGLSRVIPQHDLDLVFPPPDYEDNASEVQNQGHRSHSSVLTRGVSGHSDKEKQTLDFENSQMLQMLNIQLQQFGYDEDTIRELLVVFKLSNSTDLLMNVIQTHQDQFMVEHEQKMKMEDQIETKSKNDSIEDKQIDYDALGCGINSAQARILGGRLSTSGDWPWQVALVHAPSKSAFCGASLINRHFVLTAAHCAYVLPVHKLLVWLGSYDVSLETEVGREVRKVSRIILHEQFDQKTLANDVALLRLSEPVNMTRTIRPICLPNIKDWDVSIVNGSADFDGLVTGWGLTKEDGQPSKVLLQVSLPFLKVEDCRQRYEGIIPISTKMLCTLHNFSDGVSRDSCKGDSGGPLVSEGPEGRWTQVGIVSFGYGCGRKGYPGVYTRITQYLLWIYLKIAQSEINSGDINMSQAAGN